MVYIIYLSISPQNAQTGSEVQPLSTGRAVPEIKQTGREELTTQFHVRRIRIVVLYRHSRIRICSAHGTLAICLNSLKFIKPGVKV